jgi:hypothetical protein
VSREIENCTLDLLVLIPSFNAVLVDGGGGRVRDDWELMDYIFKAERWWSQKRRENHVMPACLPLKGDNVCDGCLGSSLTKFEARWKMSKYEASMQTGVLRLRWLAGIFIGWT